MRLAAAPPLTYTCRMDRDSITALSSVNKRLDKLHKGQADLTGYVDRLTEGQARHDVAFAGVNSRLDNIEAVLVKVVEGQVKHDVAIAKLEAVAIRTAGQLNALAGEVQHLGQHMDSAIGRLTEAVGRNSDDIRHLAEQVVHGFAKRDEDHAALDARVTKMEADRQ